MQVMLQWRHDVETGACVASPPGRSRVVGGLLKDAPRPGRRKRIRPEKVEAIVNATLHTTPRDATHWSVRSLAQAQRVSPATVHRIWQAAHLQPHRTKTFKLSRDPHFVRKLRDVVGLYMNPPAKALVLSVDEKRSRPWTGPSRSCPCGRGCRRARPTITRAMERRRCSPPSMSSRDM